MSNELCEHNICFVFCSYRDIGILTEEELYNEVKEWQDELYQDYYYPDNENIAMWRKDYVPEFDYSFRNYCKEYLNDMYLYRFAYCPDCGKKLNFSYIQNRINKRIFNYINTLPKLTEERIKELKQIAHRELREQKQKSQIAKKANGKGYVYLVRLDKHYKIGISKNPKDRLKEFTLLPYPLEDICIERVANYEQCEEELHLHFDNKRVRGEWFELDEEDIEYIKKYLEERRV